MKRITREIRTQAGKAKAKAQEGAKKTAQVARRQAKKVRSELVDRKLLEEANRSVERIKAKIAMGKKAIKTSVESDTTKLLAEKILLKAKNVRETLSRTKS